MTERMLHEHAQPDAASLDMLRMAMEKLKLSARAYGRILKVARTIADLAASPKVQQQHIAEAVGYRNLDRGDWAEKGGDYIGGRTNYFIKHGYRFKGMNIYCFDTEKEFKLPGRINEDASAYYFMKGYKNYYCSGSKYSTSYFSSTLAIKMSEICSYSISS